MLLPLDVRWISVYNYIGSWNTVPVNTEVDTVKTVVNTSVNTIDTTYNTVNTVVNTVSGNYSS